MPKKLPQKRSPQFAHTIYDTPRPCVAETIGAMVAPRYGHSADIRAARHFNVECRVANHNCIFGSYTGLAQRLKYHSRMWFRRRLVGGLDCENASAIQTAPTPAQWHGKRARWRSRDAHPCVRPAQPATRSHRRTALPHRLRRREAAVEPSVSGNHLFDRRVRSGQFQENKLEGHSDQRKTFVFGRRGKSELTEHDTNGSIISLRLSTRVPSKSRTRASRPIIPSPSRRQSAGG